MRFSMQRPISPGDVLWEEFLKPLGLTAKDFALKSGLPEHVIRSVLAATDSVNTEAAKHLARGTGTSPEFWLDLETKHDEEVQKAIGHALSEFCGRIVTPDMLDDIRLQIHLATRIAARGIALTCFPREGRLEAEVRKGGKSWGCTITAIIVWHQHEGASS